MVQQNVKFPTAKDKLSGSKYPEANHIYLLQKFFEA
jgi:hypothetical protein